MISQGLKVMRFSNERVLNETEAILEEIAESLVRLEVINNERSER